ncbi:MAG: class E sortase [Candidatus Microthrix sp.]|nr:class E sortase [Candidatus Microthrix sp.]
MGSRRCDNRSRRPFRAGAERGAGARCRYHERTGGDRRGIDAGRTPAVNNAAGDPGRDHRLGGRSVGHAHPGRGRAGRGGCGLGALLRGAGHWPGTAEPGQTGNMVIAGHRTTHGAPFRRLDELRVGDDVGIGASGQVVTYRVTGTEIVDPGQVEVARPTTTATATLFACHPPGSAAKRIVVRLARSA